jgi:hypothetical protein
MRGVEFLLSSVPKPLDDSSKGNVMNDGGPAFPQPDELEKGMTLRDYFAAAAIGAAMSQFTMTYPKDFSDASALAYQQADALLAEREKGK